MPGIRRALALAATLVLFTVAVASAQSATPCLDAHSAFEANAGRPENVGLYLRVAGDTHTAERRCQLEHAGQLQFTWFYPGYVPAPSPAQTPEPPPAPLPAAPDPTTHPDYWRVFDTAQARGAEPQLAARIATDVIARGSVDAFLRGTDDGVQYGRAPCQWRSSACPLAPEYVPPPEPPPAPVARGPRIDPGLRPAWNLLTQLSVWRMFDGVDNAATVRVRWGPLPSHGDGRRTSARYRPSTNTITISEWYRGERPAAIAPLLAHELWHAVSYIPYPRDFDACVVDEVLAHVLEGFTWGILELRPVTDLEVSHHRVALLVAQEIDYGDFDDDVSDWPRLLRHVLYNKNYATHCQP